jgi:uncharacterized protein (DUF1330 family)
MPAYLVADVDVHDPERYAEYVRLASGTVDEHGGRYLVRGGETEALEGDWSPRRLIVIEFPSRAAARAWYDSPRYREARAVRQSCSRGDFVVVDGV